MDGLTRDGSTASASGRDAILDLLKGAGCLLMIMAHSALKLQNYDEFTFYGGLAPVMFFGPAAVTASFQVGRHKPRGVLVTYLFLLLIGFSFNRITDVGFLGELEMDMLQIIAVGAALIFLLELYVRPRLWVYLLFGVLFFAGKFLVQDLLRGISISGVTNLIAPPGVFPIFPWLFLFFFGLFAYRVRNVFNLVIAVGCAAAAFLLRELGVTLLIRNKWDMTIGYFLVCAILWFGSVFVLRAVPWFRNARVLSWLSYLGRNSLLFLYVHFPLILYFKEIRNLRTVPVIREYPFLFWLIILALTALIMLLLLRLARWERLASVFDHLAVWILITIAVFAGGLLIQDDDLVYALEVSLGTTAALFFPRLVGILKEKRRAPTARPAAQAETGAVRGVGSAGG